jgi:hypothetical protein
MKPAVLPFLVVHARVAWWIVVPLLTLLVAVSWFVLRARYRRWDSTRRARQRLLLAGPVETGTRMLRGVLRGGPARTGEWVEGLWFDCDGVRVDVNSNLDVAAGTTTVSGGAHLAEGDSVLVEGSVGRLGERWVIEAPIAHGPAWWRGEMAPEFPPQRVDKISVWAETPHLPPISRKSRIVSVIAIAGIVYGGLRLTGSIALDSLRDDHHVVNPPQIGALALATLVGPTRDRALAVYGDKLSSIRTETAIRERLALAELKRDCHARIDILVDFGYWQDALDLTARCGDDERRTRAALLAGRFDQVPADADAREREVAAIMSGDFENAIKADAQRERRGADCVREYLLERVGRPDPTARCEPMRAALRHHERKPLEPDPLGLFPLASVIEGCTTMVNIQQWRVGIEWLAPACPADQTSVSALSLRTELAILHGDDTKAVEMQLRAAMARGDLDEWERNELSELYQDIVLRTDRVEPIDGPTPGAALRSGRAPEERALSPSKSSALAAASNGDGAQLADYVISGPVFEYDPLLLLAVLPRVTRHRAELVSALRSRELWIRDSVAWNPFEIVHQAAVERDIARLAGNKDIEERWQSIIARHADSLSHGERVIALLLLVNDERYR